jgi:hypothetical protein
MTDPMLPAQSRGDILSIDQIASGDPVGYRGWVGNDMTGASFVYHENAVLPLGPDDGTVDHLLIVSLLVPRRTESG